MEKEEMLSFVLMMFQKERRIWKTWLTNNDSDLARNALERVEQAERSFREAMGL